MKEINKLFNSLINNNNNNNNSLTSNLIVPLILDEYLQILYKLARFKLTDY